MIYTTISFVTVTKNGIVKQIGNSVGYFATSNKKTEKEKSDKNKAIIKKKSY